MRCQSIDECMTEIRDYTHHTPSFGLPMLVNIDDYDNYRELVSRFWADSNKEIVKVSDFCTREDGFPHISEAIIRAFSPGCHVLLGICQAERLLSRKKLQECVDSLINKATQGYTIIILDHMADEMRRYIEKDLRLNQRIVLFDNGHRSVLPQIRLLKEDLETDGAPNSKSLIGLKQLLEKLENISNHEVEENSEIQVITQQPEAMFHKSEYNVKSGIDAFENIILQHVELADILEREWGKEEEWLWLWSQLRTIDFHEFVRSRFQSTELLEMHLAEIIDNGSEREQWIYFIALKVLRVSNPYMEEAVQRTEKASNLLQTIYDQILEYEAFNDGDDAVYPDFWKSYAERDKLLRNVNIPPVISRALAEKSGAKGKAGICYLTSANEDERYQIIRYLSDYDYSEELLQDILAHVAPELADYMSPYHFMAAQADMADDKQELCDRISDYFATYRRQKICNCLEPQFLEEIERLADERPYNRFMPRLKILKDLDCANDTAYFFDALGVEFVPFIALQARKYGLTADIRIAKAELPTITAMNTADFKDYFLKPCKDIKALDECKHNVQRYNYDKVKEPYHIFEELSIIEKVLSDIYSTMSQQKLDRAIIVSDHGASRMAVLANSENSSMIKVDGVRGEHSGRCCKTDYDMKLPKAAYENGYEVLANYDRFKGSRKADVEVHGGASLEEVIVPVISLQLFDKDVDYMFENDGIVHIDRKKPTRLKLYSNKNMRNPGLMINGKLYQVSSWNGKQHAVFELPEIKRRGTYEAQVYEGTTATGKKLRFELVKETHEVDFGF